MFLSQCETIGFQSLCVFCHICLLHFILLYSVISQMSWKWALGPQLAEFFEDECLPCHHRDMNKHTCWSKRFLYQEGLSLLVLLFFFCCYEFPHCLSLVSGYSSVQNLNSEQQVPSSGQGLVQIQKSTYSIRLNQQ